MNPNWAEENLQTIRTLMERSALYRRALAPIMLLVGALGIAAAAIGALFQLGSAESFSCLWLGTAWVALIGAFLVARRQAVKVKEAFWSPPARRVFLAMFPSWLVGIVVTDVFRVIAVGNFQLAWWLLPIWMILYGLGLFAAAFFISNSIRIFSWVFLMSGLAVLVLLLIKNITDSLPSFIYANYAMGFFFGLLHLAYSIYLYLTEKGKTAA